MSNADADYVATGQTARNRTVLVVEDNPQAAKLISMCLGRAGYQPVVAGTGEEALAVAGRLYPMAILLDILLPGMDGWEVLTRLKASPATRDIPVVILSVLDRQALGFQLGATDYLVKPLEKAQLLRALGRCALRTEAPGASYRVMVVDEDPAEPGLLAEILYRHGYDVIQALGHAEARHLLGICLPDLVVLDLLIARMEHADDFVQLSAAGAAARIPFLLVTDAYPPPQPPDRPGAAIESFAMKRGNGEEALLAAVGRMVRRGREPSREGC